MATESGYSNQKKIGDAQFKTIQSVGSDKWGAASVNKALFELSAVPSAIVDAAIDEDDAQRRYVIVEITGHGARQHDVLRMISGSLIAWEFEILSIIDANLFVIPNIAGSIPQAADTAKIMRWVTSKADSEGNVNFSPGPTTFVRDGVTTTVTEDTVTPANNRPLPVKLTGMTGDITVTAQNLNVQSTHTGANPDSMQIGDGTEIMAINPDGSINIGGSALPTGAATEAKQDSQITELQDIEADVEAMSAKLPATLGQKAMAASLAVVIASDQSSFPVTVAGGATEAKQDTQITELQDIEADVEALSAKFNSLGQKLMAASAPVVIASDQSTIPVSQASQPLPTGAATEAKQDTQITELQDIEADVEAVSAKLPATLGQKAMAASLAVVLASDQSTIPVSQASQPLPTGAATEAKQDSQITELQDIEADVEAMSAKLPATLGQKAMAASLAVVLASDQSSIPVASTLQSQAGTITTTQKTVGTSAVRATVDGNAPSASRKKLMLKPSAANTGKIYLGASGVTTANGLEIIGPDRLEFELDSGDYYLISDTAAQVVEILEKA